MPVGPCHSAKRNDSLHTISDSSFMAANGVLVHTIWTAGSAGRKQRMQQAVHLLHISWWFVTLPDDSEWADKAGNKHVI